MNGGDRIDSLETQRCELCCAGGCLIVIGLVHHHQDWLLDRTQLLGHLLIQRDDALLNVDDQQNHVRRLDGQIHLQQCGSGDHIGGFFPAQQTDTARVHQRVGATMPFGLGHHSVTSDTGLIMNNSDAATDDSIEERGLADVGTAHDGDKT